MTIHHHPVSEATDDELITRVNADDRDAYGELYRRHVGAARSTARWLLHSSQDVEDVVSEAFAGALAALRNGNGPRDNFRFYVLACVRNGCMRRSHSSRSTPTDPTTLTEIAPTTETVFGYAEANTVTRAFSTLSPRWQRMLWLTEVEQRPVGEVAREMQMSSSAVSALSQRARHAFASAYLSEHVATATMPECATFGPRLGKFVRGETGELDRRRIEHHLESCDSCRDTVDDLRDVNACLRELQLPGGIAAAGSATLAASAGAGSVGLGSFGGWAASALGGWMIKVAVVVLIAAPLVASDTAKSGHAAQSTTTTLPLPSSTRNGTTSASTGTNASASHGTGSSSTGAPGNASIGNPTGSSATTPLGSIIADTPPITLPGTGIPIGAATGPLTGTALASAIPTLPTLPVAAVVAATTPGGVAVTIPHGGIGVTVTVPAGGGIGAGITSPIAGVGLSVSNTGVAGGVDVTTPAAATGATVGVTGNGATVGVGGGATVGASPVTVGATATLGGS